MESKDRLNDCNNHINFLINSVIVPVSSLSFSLHVYMRLCMSDLSFFFFFFVLFFSNTLKNKKEIKKKFPITISICYVKKRQKKKNKYDKIYRHAPNSVTPLSPPYLTIEITHNHNHQHPLFPQ